MSLPQAGLADALPDFNLSPLISTIGLPNAQHGADLVERGHTRWRSSIVTASHSTEDTDGNESLLFDGETTVASLGFDYGLRDRLQIGVELPYVLHESGGLDSFIDSWHDWFGLPDGIRTQIGQDQLNFIYQVDGNDLLNFGNNRAGSAICA